MAKKSKNSGLGLGLDALIKSKTRSTDETKNRVNPLNSIEKQDKQPKEKTSPKKEIPLNDPLKDVVLTEIEKNPRITLWSQKSSAVLRYLKKTTPEFSISKEASLLIDDAVKNKYPEIWDLFEDL